MTSSFGGGVSSLSSDLNCFMSSQQARHPFQAFPNAYLETDEPPNRIRWERITAIVGMLGTAYFGLTILALTLFDSDYNPISQAASDYGVGRFAVEMNLGFFIGGMGLIAFAWAIGRTDMNVKSRGGSALFFVAGLVLIMNSYFTTNIEGGPSTTNGTIHGLGGFVFFVTAPIGVILVSRKFGRGRLLTAILGLVIGFVLLAMGGLSGLAERVILLVVFATVILASLDLAGFSRTAPVGQGQSSAGARRDEFGAHENSRLASCKSAPAGILYRK